MSLDRRALILICGYLTPNDLYRFALVCKEWCWNKWRNSDQQEIWLQHYKNRPLHTEYYYVYQGLQMLKTIEPQLLCYDLNDARMLLQLIKSNEACVLNTETLNRYDGKLLYLEQSTEKLQGREEFKNLVWIFNNDFYLIIDKTPLKKDDSKGQTIYLFKNYKLIFELELPLDYSHTLPRGIQGKGKRYDELELLMSYGEYLNDRQHGDVVIYHIDEKTPMFIGDMAYDRVRTGKYYDRSGYEISDRFDYIQQTVRQTHECTYRLTRQDYLKQSWYFCNTCYPQNTDIPGTLKGCCVVCAVKCHAGHELDEKILRGDEGFFCDCYIGELGIKCKAMPCSSESIEQGCGCPDYVLINPQNPDLRNVENEE